MTGASTLTVFNFLWEIPTRIAEWVGWKRPAPTANWLSDSDFRNLFDLTGLEIVRAEDRMMLPLGVPGLAAGMNQVLARVPPLERLTLYRIYVLRKRRREPVPRRLSVSVVVPARSACRRETSRRPSIAPPVMGGDTELLDLSSSRGNSTDDTWATIQRLPGRAYCGPLKLSAYPADAEGKGKGDAVRLGFAKGDERSGLMILDADLTVPP